MSDPIPPEPKLETSLNSGNESITTKPDVPPIISVTPSIEEKIEPQQPTQAPQTPVVPVPDEEFLSYESISGTVPFEEMYNSEERLNDPLQDIVTIPENYLVTDTFTKFHRTNYAAKPDVICLFFFCGFPFCFLY